jgi:hypothetical protein
MKQNAILEDGEQTLKKDLFMMHLYDTIQKQSGEKNKEAQ